MSIKFRFVQEEELPAVNAFNGNKIPAWKQEFFSSRKPQSFLSICEDGDRIIGTEGYMDYPMLENGRPFLAHRSERTLVAAEYRGKNIFKGMIDLCCEAGKAQGSWFCYGATAARKALERAGFFYRSGYRTYAILPLSNTKYFFRHFIRGKGVHLNPVKLYKKLRGRDILASKEAATAAAHGQYFFRKLFKRNATPHLEHLAIPRDWSDIDALHTRFRQSETLISLQHNPQLFEWLEIEGKNRYLKVFSYEGDLLRSYVCIHLDAHNSYASVLDFCTDSSEAFADTIAHVKKVVLQHGFTALLFALNIENLEQRTVLKWLQKMGASRFGKVGTWVIKPMCLETSHLYDSMESWYLTDLWFALIDRNQL